MRPSRWLRRYDGLAFRTKALLIVGVIVVVFAAVLILDHPSPTCRMHYVYNPPAAGDGIDYGTCAPPRHAPG